MSFWRDSAHLMDVRSYGGAKQESSHLHYSLRAHCNLKVVLGRLRQFIARVTSAVILGCRPVSCA